MYVTNKLQNYLIKSDALWQYDIQGDRDANWCAGGATLTNLNATVGTYQLLYNGGEQ